MTIQPITFIPAGNASAAAFGELLECSHTLRELDLSWNQVGPRPAHMCS